MAKRTSSSSPAPLLPEGTQGWMVKSEPEAYAWSDLVQDGQTAWTGVRSNPARLNLRTMKKGDLAFFYHSVTEKAVVGIARVKKTAYPDATAEDPAAGWVCVDLEPVAPLERPLSLAEIKAHPVLQHLALVRQSRLSVLPVTREQWEALVALAAT